MKYVLGIDLGTSSLKGLLIDEYGNIITSKSSSYDLITLQSGYSEQNPQDWCDAFDEVVKGIVSEGIDCEDIVAISFSGQMHSLVTLDKDDKVIRNAILWNDTRVSKECDYIMSNFGDELLKITKNRALEGFTLPKLLWMRENEKDNFEKINTFLLPKDYLAFYTTKVKQMEYSDAAGTLMLDIKNKIWSKEIIDYFKLDSKIFPKLQNSYDLVGRIDEAVALKVGLSKNTLIYSGAADNACAAIGAGIIDDSMAMASIGTSGVFLSYEKDYTKEYNGDLHYFNHANGAYYSMGVTLSAGNSLNWFVKEFYDNKNFNEILKNIKNIPLGSDGLMFVPYLMGERSPHFDSKVRASFIGIDQHHTKEYFLRSVLEGITFSLKDCQEIMEKVKAVKFDKIVSVGGAAKNKEWLQMQADIFNAKIVTLKTEEGPALGAAIIAAVGACLFNSFEDCIAKFVKYQDAIIPSLENVKKYRELYEIYQTIYPSIKDTTHSLQKYYENNKTH
ncbi:MAG: xylulokinase [Anaerorhabdus sp.]